MARRIFVLGIGSAGVVSVLIFGGLLIKMLCSNSSLGDFALMAGVGIAVVMGVLGILGIVISLSNRLN